MGLRENVVLDLLIATLLRGLVIQAIKLTEAHTSIESQPLPSKAGKELLKHTPPKPLISIEGTVLVKLPSFKKVTVCIVICI